jgi:hypothetical protein
MIQHLKFENKINKLVPIIIVTRIYIIKTLFKQGVCHIVALPFTFLKYFKGKEKLWNLKYFTMQKYNLQKML